MQGQEKKATRPHKRSILRGLVQGSTVVLVALTMTMMFFVLLPVILAMTEQKQPDTIIRQVDSVQLDQPKDPEEPEPEPEPEEKEPEPELQSELQTLDLAQLELALGAGMGGGWSGDGFSMKVESLIPGGKKRDADFSMADLDERPTATRRESPRYTPAVKKVVPGRVTLRFIVNEQGRVEKPMVVNPSHPALVGPALEAIRKWRFDPGKRKGKPVAFRMQMPMRFPKF